MGGNGSLSVTISEVTSFNLATDTWVVVCVMFRQKYVRNCKLLILLALFHKAKLGIFHNSLVLGSIPQVPTVA